MPGLFTDTSVARQKLTLWVVVLKILWICCFSFCHLCLEWVSISCLESGQLHFNKTPPSSWEILTDSVLLLSAMLRNATLAYISRSLAMWSHRFYRGVLTLPGKAGKEVVQCLWHGTSPRKPSSASPVALPLLKLLSRLPLPQPQNSIFFPLPWSDRRKVFFQALLCVLYQLPLSQTTWRGRTLSIDNWFSSHP